MYELRTALSYLVPHRGQLSVSVVGSIAVLVIQAIAWLVLVFFSTTEGFERRWSDKIVGITAALQLVPDKKYFEQFAESIPRLSQTTAPLIRYLEEEQVPFRFFESTVSHVSIPSLEAIPGGSLSQYACLLGVDFINPEKLCLVSELSPLELERYLSLLSSPNQPELYPLIDCLETFDVFLTRNCQGLPAGTKLKATLSKGPPPSIHLLLPNASSIVLPASEAPVAVMSVSLKSAPLALPASKLFSFVSPLGYPLLLPKQMRQQGARLLDRGVFEFSSMALTGGDASLTLPFYVAGFFDAGILPIGSKLALTSRKAVTTIQPDLVPAGPIPSSGIFIDVPLSRLAVVQKRLQHAVEQKCPGMFLVQKYDQFDFTEDMFQQLKSEKALFRLISIIIVIVACSNIFSMLFILAHDRRKEIAVLRALGAPKKSILLIFLLAGLLVGLVGASLGASLAGLTLHFLPEILAGINRIQGQELLNPAIYGEICSQTINLPTLVFTLFSISITSACTGIFAAVRACRTNVSEALKS